MEQTLLLTHLRYRKDLNVSLSVDLADFAPTVGSHQQQEEGAGSRGLRVAEDYVIDDEHSNAFDAGLEHAELELLPAPAIQAGTLTLELKPRSVHLLVIQPATLRP